MIKPPIISSLGANIPLPSGKNKRSCSLVALFVNTVAFALLATLGASPYLRKGPLRFRNGQEIRGIPPEFREPPILEPECNTSGHLKLMQVTPDRHRPAPAIPVAPETFAGLNEGGYPAAL